MREFIVAAIDDDRILKHNLRVGLGTNALREFSLKRQDRWTGLENLRCTVNANKLGLADLSYYGAVDIHYDGRIENAMVYNVFGTMLVKDDEVRVSPKLAEVFELRVGDVVGISLVEAK